MTREEKNEEIQNEIFEEEKKETRKKRIRFLFKLIIFLFILTTIFYSYTTYVSTSQVGVREYRIINSKIPDDFNGLKIIQFSDLHFGSTMFLEDVKKIVNLMIERNPDIVVFTGDLLQKNYHLTSEEQEKLIQQLKSIPSSLGKYAILGDEDTEKISTIFNQSDFTILRDEYDLIYKDNNSSILLVGLSSYKKGQDTDKAYSYFKEENHNYNIYTISLLHEPDAVEDIIGIYPTDLFLAGHSHNGDIRIPFFQYPLHKVEGALSYHQDFYSIQNSSLYISSGLGTKSGIRLFCRPSINFFRLSNQ